MDIGMRRCMYMSLVIVYVNIQVCSYVWMVNMFKETAQIHAVSCEL